MEGIFVVVCILVVLFVVFDQLHLRKQRRQSSSFPTRGSVRQSIDSRNQTSRPSDVTIDMLEGMPYGWVSTAIGGSEPQQMVRAMQTSGMSQLDALAQMCEAGFDAFCRSLADTANVRGAAGYYKGRERDLYKTNLLKVIAEHYGRPMAEQVIDRLEPPAPKPTVPELSPDTTSPQTSAEPDPNDMLRLTQLIYLDTKNRWGSFLEKEAEDNALLRVMNLDTGQEEMIREEVIRIAQRFWEKESTLPTFGFHQERFRWWAAEMNVLDNFFDRQELFYLQQQFRYLLTDLYDQELADAVVEPEKPYWA